MPLPIHRRAATDSDAMRGLNEVFAIAFEDDVSYRSAKPSDAYLARLLAKPEVVVLVAKDGDTVVAGLVAYALEKLEQERAELYVYDLAVRDSHRRRGIATALLRELGRIAKTMGAWVMYVQADHGDAPAIALYESLGTREEVLHFDIPPEG
ncbi:MAG: AAC(3)-I family aminoglycoside N-acetyltransferase [Polyangiaceae bacterium]